MSASGNPLTAMGGNSPMGTFGQALPGFLQYFFGNSGAPYREARNAFTPFFNEAKGYQQPFYNQGVNAMGGYNDWVNSMKNPSDFINNLMSKYQESPYAHNLQQQSIRAGQNIGSAEGTIGSTPMQMQLQQNASNIASGDMNQWLQQVLGINTNYGGGLKNQMDTGQHAADFLSQLLSQGADYMGSAAYGEEAGRQNDKNSLWAGIGKLFGG